MYRLVCTGTVEDRIVQRAQQKHAVQELVMTGRADRDTMAAEDVMGLLLDDVDDPEDRARLQERLTLSNQPGRGGGGGVGGGPRKGLRMAVNGEDAAMVDLDEKVAGDEDDEMDVDGEDGGGAKKAPKSGQKRGGATSAAGGRGARGAAGDAGGRAKKKRATTTMTAGS